MLTNGETNERHLAMDCRVKPGNDGVKKRSRGASAPEFCSKNESHCCFASK
jgi:hypothetical protein